jgi:hypothetical protein
LTTLGTNAYGGSVSFYVGAYAWSFSRSDISRSTCGATSASGLSVSVDNAPCSNCSAETSGGWSFGANSYGGSMSVLYVGAYSWSLSNGASDSAISSSTSGRTIVSGLSVSVVNASCFNCSAFSMNSGGDSNGANAYGGSMSVVYIGAYAWSQSNSAISNSSCGGTSARGLSVSISNVPCSNCSAVTSRKGVSYGANAYGGSLSIVYIGAYAWSFSNGLSDFAAGSSSCGETDASGLSVSVSNVPCFDCSANTSSSRSLSYGANSYGGSLSVLYVGAYTWSWSAVALSSSTCGETSASGLSVSVDNAPCFNCSAVTIRLGRSHGANAYGGSMSVSHVGAYAWSLSSSGSRVASVSVCGPTLAVSLVISILNSSFSKSNSVSRKCSVL